MVKDLGRGGGRGRGAWEVEERGVVEGGLDLILLYMFIIYYFIFYLYIIYWICLIILYDWNI